MRARDRERLHARTEMMIEELNRIRRERRAEMLYCAACSEGRDLPPCPSCESEGTLVLAYTGDALCQVCGATFNHDDLPGHELRRVKELDDELKAAARRKNPVAEYCAHATDDDFEDAEDLEERVRETAGGVLPSSDEIAESLRRR